jgi:hypothetical protein
MQGSGKPLTLKYAKWSQRSEKEILFGALGGVI